MSSLGALELRTDAWGLDVVITGSQKALMGPPGAVFVSVSPRAWDAVRSARMPKLYFSFERAREQLSPHAGFTPYTPAVPVIYALQASLAMILRDGLQARFAHHARLARATREGVAALGLDLLADPRWASDTVTAVRAPAGVNLEEMLRKLRTDYGVELAGGQGRLEGRIFRIGHMGYVQGAQILAALEALEHILAHSGRGGKNGAAVTAATPYLRIG